MKVNSDRPNVICSRSSLWNQSVHSQELGQEKVPTQALFYWLRPQYCYWIKKSRSLLLVLHAGFWSSLTNIAYTDKVDMSWILFCSRQLAILTCVIILFVSFIWINNSNDDSNGIKTNRRLFHAYRWRNLWNIHRFYIIFQEIFAFFSLLPDMVGCLGLWHINLWRLFNAYSIYMQMVSSISNNSV